MSYPYNNTNFNVRATDIFKMFKLWKLLYILKADRIAMIQFNFNCLFQTHADTCWTCYLQAIHGAEHTPCYIWHE